MATIQEILSGRNLTGLIQGVKSGLPVRVPAQFLTPNKTVRGQHGTYMKVNGNRQTARIVQYGSAAERRGQSGVTEVPFNCIHSFESMHFNPTDLISLLSKDETQQKLGRDEVVRQTGEFKALFQNLRLSAVAMALMRFHIYADAKGNLQTGSGGAMVDVDYGVPSTNFNSGAAGINPLGTGNIVTAQWSTAGTKIIEQLRKLKSAAVKFTGYPLEIALYGNDVPKHLAANTEASNYLLANNELSRKYLETGEVPAGFMGLAWFNASDQFFVDENNAVQTILADDEVVLLPAPSPDWYEFVQGTYPVPSNFQFVQPDVTAMLQGMAETAGMFSYAGGTLNPPTVEQFAGDTFLPIIKVPGAVYRIDTHW